MIIPEIELAFVFLLETGLDGDARAPVGERMFGLRLGWAFNITGSSPENSRRSAISSFLMPIIVTTDAYQGAKDG